MKIQVRTFIILVSISLFALVSFPAFAQKISKIVAVDTEKSIEDSIWGKKTLEELGKERDVWRMKLEQFKKEQVTPLEEQLAKQKAFLEDNQAESKLQNDIESKYQDLDRMIQQGNMALSSKQDELLKPILDELKDLIKRLSIKEGYDIVLEKRVIVLYLNPELDITSQVTIMLDEVYKEKIAGKEKTEQTKTEGANPEKSESGKIDEKSQK